MKVFTELLSRSRLLSISRLLPSSGRCCLCPEVAPRGLCLTCLDRLRDSVYRHRYQLAPRLPLITILPYHSPWRELILEAKIAGNSQALQAWQTLAGLYGRRIKPIEVVVPAPSSLWSRLRGRYDLAWVTANHLARVHRAKLLEAPLPLQWKVRKQTYARRSLNNRWSTNSLLSPPLTGKRILLVDDVLTSGATLRQLANFFRGNILSAFTLCLSPNHSLLRR